MKGNMIFGIYGHNETSISSCMAVPFNDIQPIWKILAYMATYPSKTLVLWGGGGIGPNIEKMVHHYGLCKIKYS